MPSTDPLQERSRHFARTPAREGAGNVCDVTTGLVTAIIPATPGRAGRPRDV